MNGCECCGGSLVVLGRLGNLLWFRCRNCGMDQSEDARELEFELNEENDDYT